MLREAPEMKYVFIEKHQAEFSIKAMCRVLRVARSGWYTWCQRRTRISPRQQFRQHCDSVVLAAFTRSKQRYGAPRLTDELRVQGYHFNVKTVAASLRRQGLRAKASRKFSPVSYRAHGLPVSENLLEQDFYASGPNQKRAGDITYLRTDEGWLYLAVIRRQLVLPTRANYTGRTLQGDIKSRLLLPSLSFSCSFPLSVRTYIRDGSACLPQPPP